MKKVIFVDDSKTMLMLANASVKKYVESGKIDVLQYENPLELKTLFTQLMLERGFLASTSIYASFAHKDDYVDLYLNTVDEVFQIISNAIQRNTVNSLLKTTVCHSGFKRLT